MGGIWGRPTSAWPVLGFQHCNSPKRIPTLPALWPLTCSYRLMVENNSEHEMSHFSWRALFFQHSITACLPLFSHTYLRLRAEQRTALRFDNADFLQTNAMLTSDNMHLKPVCEYVQCRFWQLMLIVSQPQSTFDQLPGKKKTGDTQSLLDFSLQDIERQGEVCLCETHLNPANGLSYY